MEQGGDLAFRKKNLLTKLMGLDVREELQGLSNAEQFRRIQLKGDIEKWLLLRKFPRDKNPGLCM